MTSAPANSIVDHFRTALDLCERAHSTAPDATPCVPPKPKAVTFDPVGPGIRFLHSEGNCMPQQPGGLPLPTGAAAVPVGPSLGNYSATLTPGPNGLPAPGAVPVPPAVVTAGPVAAASSAGLLKYVCYAFILCLFGALVYYARGRLLQYIRDPSKQGEESELDEEPSLRRPRKVRPSARTTSASGAETCTLERGARPVAPLMPTLLTSVHALPGKVQRPLPRVMKATQPPVKAAMPVVALPLSAEDGMNAQAKVDLRKVTFEQEPGEGVSFFPETEEDPNFVPL
jgi:hypothetical protein